MSAKTKQPLLPQAVAPPVLDRRHMTAATVAGVVLLVMALLQLLSFNVFTDNFSAVGYSNPNVLAAVVIFAELWAAFGFFRVRLSWAFRAVSNYLAVAVAVFWMFHAFRGVTQYSDLQMVVDGKSAIVSNFFGKYLTQPMGWWTVIEATVFLFVVLYAVEGIRDKAGVFTATKVTRRTR
jgi:hypothetical protein